jgi:hypothetical protein
MTARRSLEEIAVPDDGLLDMLRVIGDSTARSDQLDSRDVSRRLGWSDAVTASSLADARARLLIWGMRVGGTPAPRFEDIELTVQGRRLLLAADRVPAGTSSPNDPPGSPQPSTP